MVGGRRKLRERGGKTASRESRNGSVRSESRCFAQGLTRPMKRSLCLGRKWVLLGLLGPITFAVMRRPSNCLSIFRYDKTPPIFQCLRFVHSTVTIGSTSKPYPLSSISLPLLPPVATPPPPPPPPPASPAPPPCRAPRRLRRRPAPPRVAAAELRRMITI